MDEDKGKVLAWMEKYCNGFRSAKTKGEILPYVCNGHLGERRFREIMSELKHERHIGSTSVLGYWFIPLCNFKNDPEEMEAAIASQNEMRKRFLSMAEDCDKNIKEFRAEAKQKQLVLA